jgi:hypothetical protein
MLLQELRPPVRFGQLSRESIGAKRRRRSRFPSPSPFSPSTHQGATHRSFLDAGRTSWRRHTPHIIRLLRRRRSRRSRRSHGRHLAARTDNGYCPAGSDPPLPLCRLLPRPCGQSPSQAGEGRSGRCQGQVKGESRAMPSCCVSGKKQSDKAGKTGQLR